jgi:hypothetical protein
VFVTEHILKRDDFFDPEAYWQSGNVPWSFFAFPTCMADEDGLPPDDDARAFLAMLQSAGIHVGVWANTPSQNGLSLFVCPKDDIELFHRVTEHLQFAGASATAFCIQRSQDLIERGKQSD